LQIRRDVPDPRRRSVIDLARRCDWHKQHSEQVARLGVKLFDDLKALHGLGPVERELIEYGSMLHDIGWHIAHDRHHKHSEYLILHGALKNFSKEEIRIIAGIARYHRKVLPTKTHPRLAKLTSRGRRIVCVGAALLRIADGLDRSHASVIQNLDCRADGKQVTVSVTARADPELEIWAARRKRTMFEKVFERSLEIVLKKS